jgi:predicted Zn-dependent peptidase
MLSEVAFEPVFPEEEVSTIIQKSQQEFLVNLEKVKFIAQLQFNKLIFGDDHPYAWTVTSDSYRQITADKLRDFHREFYTKRPFKIFISGKFPSNIQEILDAHFGHHKINRKANGSLNCKAQPSPENHHFVQKKDALQHAIRIGKTLFNKHHPDFIKMQVVNTILGGYFGSRLMTNIREDKGYTYGIGSSLLSLQHDGIFTIATEVGTDVKDQALEEIAKEIEKLRTELVPDEELKLVKNYILGTFLRSADGPFALSELLKSVVDYELTLDYFEDFLETVKSITANQIKDLAVKYLDPSTMVTLVVGK